VSAAAALHKGRSQKKLHPRKPQFSTTLQSGHEFCSLTPLASAWSGQRRLHGGKEAERAPQAACRSHEQEFKDEDA